RNAVVVGECQIFAPRRFHAREACRDRAFATALDEPHGRASPGALGYFVGRSIGGPVVDDDDLEVVERLLGHRLQKPAQQGPPVSRRDDDGNSGRVAQGSRCAHAQAKSVSAPLTPLSCSPPLFSAGSTWLRGT